jgi:predicted DCC family thiol-disulfide oxidoreductase YuxK
MKSLDHKLIIYDSNCKVCSSLREVVLKFTSIPEVKIKAYKYLQTDLTNQVDADQFKNVMALVDTAGGKTLYGAEGIAYIFSTQYKVVEFLFRFPFVFRLFAFLYKIQAYNRYIIATPKSNYKCDCLPDRVVRYRLSYIVITCLASLFLIATLGASVGDLFDVSSIEAAASVVSILGLAWTVQIILAILFMRRDALDYVGHLNSIIFAGLLIMVPWMLFYFITGVFTVYLLVISTLISIAYMIHLHVHRIQYLEQSQWWTVSWIVLMHASIFFCIYSLYIN